MDLGALVLGVLSSIYSAMAPTHIDEQALIKKEEFLKKYFTAQKELPRYLETLLCDLPSDPLYGILSHYLALIGKTRETVCDDILARSILAFTKGVEAKHMFGNLFCEKTSDRKYYIMAKNPTSTSKCYKDSELILWDIDEKARSLYFCRTPFVHLKKKNQLLCYQQCPDGTFLVLRDIAKQQMIMKKSITNESYTPLIVDALENYCVFNDDNGVTFIDLNTQKIQDLKVPMQQHKSMLFNNEGNVCAVVSGVKTDAGLLVDPHLQIFVLKNNVWEHSIADFKLPLFPTNNYFMHNNHLLLHDDLGNLLHLQLLRDDNDEYKIRTVTQERNLGLQNANQHFFSITKGSDLFLFAYDGSLVQKIHEFNPHRSNFSKDGRYYAATACGLYGSALGGLQIALKKPAILLLSLHSTEKTAHIVRHNDSLLDPAEVVFHENGSLFLIHDRERCLLYSTSQEKPLCMSQDTSKKGYCDYTFASNDGCAIIMRQLSQKCTFLSDEDMQRLPLAHEIGFADYFLFNKQTTNDACTQKLVECAGERSKDIYSMIKN